MGKFLKLKEKPSGWLGVLVFNLALLGVLLVLLSISYSLYNHWFSPKELAISNTIFNKDDLPQGGQTTHPLKSESWYLSSEEKIQSLKKQGHENRYIIQVLKHFMTEDEVLSTKPKPEFSTRVRSFYQNKKVYEVEYSFDRFSRRVTPFEGARESTVPLNERAFSAFFGGSFAFGDGVAARETLPFYFGRMTGIVPFNYGVQGYGPQHMYLQIKKGPLKKQIPFEKGIIVYFYMPHHRNRLVGSMKELHWSQGRFPYLEISDFGEPLFKGSFKEARPYYYKTMEILSSVEAFSSRVDDIPAPYSASVTNKLCRLLEETQKEVSRQFKWSRFVVLIAPSTPREDDIVASCLGPKKIMYADARRMGAMGAGKLTLLEGVENHYRPEVYQYMASLLVSRLKSSLSQLKSKNEEDSGNE